MATARKVCIACDFKKTKNPLILSFSIDGHDEVHAGLGVNQENVSPVQFCKEKQHDTETEGFLPVAMSLLVHGYCHSPEPISRTRHWGARGTQFGTVPGPASVAPHHPKYRNDFGSRRHSLPQEASYSFNYSLFSLSSVADTTSEGLELLR